MQKDPLKRNLENLDFKPSKDLKEEEPQHGVPSNPISHAQSEAVKPNNELPKNLSGPHTVQDQYMDQYGATSNQQ